MKLILVVGQPASGKTHFVKKHFVERLENFLVYDVYNYEYNELEELDPETYRGKGKGKYVGDNEAPILENLHKYRNTAFIMEDATIFLDNHKKGKDFKKVVYGRRHSNTMIVLLFHALNRVPKWLFEQSNILVLFKTQDFEADLKAKFKDPRLQNAYTYLKSSPNAHERVILKMF